MTPTLFADFQNTDPRGRVRLNCVGTVAVLGTQGVELAGGLHFRLSDSEVEADGTATFSADEHLWVAVMDWTAVRYVGVG